MAVITWPTSLPTGFLAGTDSQTAENNLLRSEMDIGPAKTRRRTTAGAGTLQGKLLLSPTQFTIFLQFWRTSLRSGALAFSFQGITALRFKEPPTWRTVRSAQGGYSEVDVVLEVLP